MNRTVLVPTVALLTMMAHPIYADCTLPGERPQKDYARDNPTYNTGAFVSKVKSMMGDHFMGYAAMLKGRRGKLLASVVYGWARTPCAPDGVRNFNTYTQASWGSVTKFVTATAVMRKVQNQAGRSLDDKMLDYLPPDWRDDVSSAYSGLTIGDLVQHKGGFKSNAPEQNGVKLTPRERLAQEEPERPVGVSRKYSNMNYVLFDFMPKFLRGQAQIEEPAPSLTDQEYDDAYRSLGGRSHEKHLRDQIFDKINTKMSCNDAMHAGQNYARNYNGPQSTGNGKLVNQTDEPGCAVGGIVISARGMLNFLHAVSRTNDIVNRETWALMARTGEDRYGWPQRPTVPRDSAMQKVFNEGHAFGHNGSRWGGKAKSQVFVFPNGMSAVVVVNSNGSDGAPKLRDVLLESYAAVLPGPERSIAVEDPI